MSSTTAQTIVGLVTEDLHGLWEETTLARASIVTSAHSFQPITVYRGNIII